MTERPLLMCGEMVRATLADIKTQTRRVADAFVSKSYAADYCPYGKPGDRLWVRETWRPQDGMTIECQYADEIEYRADGDRPKQPTDCYWKPSIFLPRWACRLVLEIVAVRVERVQDISEADCKAEGVSLPWAEVNGQKRPLLRLTGKYPPGDYLEPLVDRKPWTATELLRAHYASLWDTLNAKRGFSWASNPWVWVVEFKRLLDTSSTPQCSSGVTQSRPFPARAVKMRKVRGTNAKRTGAGGVVVDPEKGKPASGGTALDLSA